MNPTYSELVEITRILAEQLTDITSNEHAIDPFDANNSVVSLDVLAWCIAYQDALIHKHEYEEAKARALVFDLTNNLTMNRNKVTS